MTTLTNAIAALGTSVEQVTQVLRDRGIKGYKRMASTCPIAQYLNYCGFKDVTVAGTTIKRYEGGPESVEVVGIPKAVVDWVCQFDDGLLPEFDRSL